MENLKRLFENSSLPGVPIVLNCKHWVVKIVWILSILLLLGVSFYFLVALTNNYYKNQEVISSQTISEYRSQFPAVSLCIPVEKDYNFYSLVMLNLSESLINCTFDGLSCNWSDFVLDTEGLAIQKNPCICYRFNSGFNATKDPIAIRYILSNDIDRGLVINLNLSKFKQHLDLNTKFKIYIENASTLFLPYGKSDSGESNTIPAGENVIKVTRELIKRSSKNEYCYNPIDRSSNKFRFVNIFNAIQKTYLQSDCLDLCIIEKICEFRLEDSDNFEKFVLSKKYDCITKSREDALLNLNQTIQEQCSEECPLDCELFSYKTSHIYLGHYFSEKNYGAELRLQLSIYYPKLEYILSTKMTKITWEDLVSQLGGVLGLFLGLSFFTLTEILIIFLEVIVEFFKTFQSKFKSVTMVIPIQKKTENLEIEATQILKRNTEQIPNKSDNTETISEIKLVNT